MYGIQNRILWDVCNKSSIYIYNSYPNQLKSQGHITNVLKNQYTNSMIVKIRFINK